MSIELARADLERLTAKVQTLRKQREDLDAELEKLEAERTRICIFLEMAAHYGPDHRKVKPALHHTGQELHSVTLGVMAEGRSPKKRTHITEEMRAKAKDLLRHNTPLPQIADTIGIAKQTMYKLARRLREELASEIPADQESKDAA